METSSPALAFQYQVTEQDYVSATLAHCRLSSPSRTFRYYLIPVLGWISVGYATYRTIVGVMDGYELSAALAWNAGFYVAGILWLLLFFIRPWRLKKMFRKDPCFKKPLQVTVEGSEWKVNTATSEGRFQAASFLRVMETPSFFFLYHSPIMFQFIPKAQLTPNRWWDCGLISIASYLFTKATTGFLPKLSLRLQLKHIAAAADRQQHL